MTDRLSKIPSWVFQVIAYIIMLIFMAGGAYREFAPREWVEQKIEQHEEKTDKEQEKRDKRIEDALKRIEDRQYEQAKERTKR